MYKKLAVTWLCLTMLFSFVVIVIEMPTLVMAGTIWVDDSFPSEDATHKWTIQAGVDNATPGDTVYVFNGTYYENVIIDKTINLTGEDRNNTIIDGGGSGDVVFVSTNWVNITGFTIRGSGSNLGPDWDAGIQLNKVKNCKVINNIASNNEHGIHLRSQSNNNTITGNTVSSNNNDGIQLKSTSNNIITNNYISNNWVGIELESSSNTIITNNNIPNNGEHCINLYSASNNNITNNNISSSGQSIIYLISSSNNIITGNNISSSNCEDGIEIRTSSNNNIITGNNISSNSEFGIHIYDSSYNTIITGNDISSNNLAGIRPGLGSSNTIIIGNNISSNNEHGIYLYQSSDNTITNNNISNNGNGTYFYQDSNNNLIRGNNILSNNEHGIYLQFSSNNNIITGNTISSNNLYGIHLYFSFYNKIFHNEIIDNVNQAYDNTNNNFWNDTYPSGGNYWSDYGGVDNFQGPEQNIPGSDGIGDTPYVIDSGSQDNYPLMVPTSLQPTLYINVSRDGKNVTIYWDPPSTTDIEYYLIYRSTYQTGFDFSTVWKNTSADKESGELDPIPLRTMWNDTNAAFPDDPTGNYWEQYYYIIRAVNVRGEVSRTSRTVGKWTTTFSKGVSTFSLPLEPLETMNTTIDYYLSDMNATYIKWMNPTTHTWMKHGEDVVNDTEMKLGEGYEVKFDKKTNYTFTGMPGAMISYDDDNGFLGFDPATEAKNLSVYVDANGNVNLTWQEPGSMGVGDWYWVYYSTTRDGFFRTFGIDYFLACSAIYFGNNTTIHINAQANNPGSRLYYIVVPFNASGVRGSSTYSIGIWTEEILAQYDTFGIPLKLNYSQTADWYCDQIDDVVGINYFIYTDQRWGWHSTRMPAGAYDPLLLMTEGYQISTSSATKFTFIGV